MSLERGFDWYHKDIRVNGFSIAGITNSFVLPKIETCIDVGQGLPFQLKADHFLITHGHMDHASGLPYVICQKNMLNKVRPKLYMLPSVARGLRKIMQAWSEVEDHSYDFDLVEVEPGKEYALPKNHYFRAFESSHRIPCLGYTIFEKKKQLKAEYQGLDSEKLKGLRREGKTLEEYRGQPIFTYTGDTKIEVLSQAPAWALESQVLAIEVSFFGKARTVENARSWGHIHWDELLPHIESLPCEKLLIVHLSARHRTSDFEELVDATLPEYLKDKVSLFPRSL